MSELTSIVSSRFSIDFSRRYSKLLGGAFRSEPTSLALAILSCGTLKTSLTSKDLIDSLTIHDRSRLEAYARNLVDHHLVTDLFPRLADLYFFSENRIHLSPLQQALLVGVGYQMKTIDQLSHEMNYPAQPLLANLQKMVRKFSKLEASTPATNGEEEQDQLEQAAKSVSALQPGTLVSIPADPSKVAAEKEEAKKKVRPSTSSKKDFSQRSKKHKREKA